MGCSTGVWFENDVETFIQTTLADYHDWRRPHTDHTIVGLELDDLGLIAVGSHEAEFVRDAGQVVTSTYLECAAVRTDLQGAVLTEVDPLDDDRPVTLGRYSSKRSCRTSLSVNGLQSSAPSLHARTRAVCGCAPASG